MADLSKFNITKARENFIQEIFTTLTYSRGHTGTGELNHIKVYTNGDSQVVGLALVELLSELHEEGYKVEESSGFQGTLDDILSRHYPNKTIVISDKPLLSVDYRYHRFDTTGITSLFIEQ